MNLTFDKNVKIRNMISKKSINWLPAILWMLVISLLSATSGKVINEIGLGAESIHISGHSLLFFVLCFFYYKATKDIKYSVLLTLLFGIVDEIHQMYTPMRSSSLFDVLTDLFGAIGAGLILWKLQYILPKKLKNWLKK